MLLEAVGIVTTGVGLVISLGLLVLTIVASWKLFEKAGLQGWKAIIPIYSTYCLY